MSDEEAERNLHRDARQTYEDENGETKFGVYRLGFRDPETHRPRFEDADSVEADAPTGDAQADEAGEQVTVSKSEDVHPSAVQTAADTNPSQQNSDGA